MPSNIWSNTVASLGGIPWIGRGDGWVDDSGSTTHHGVLNSGASISGIASSFDGSDDYIQVPSSSDFDVTTNWSIEAIVEFDPAVSTPSHSIMHYGTTGATNGFALLGSNLDGSGRILVHTTLATVPIGGFTANGTIVLGQKYHVVCTLASATLLMYLDGVSVSFTANNGSESNEANLRFGNRTTVGQRHMYGLNYGSAIYKDVALSAAQVLSLYTASITHPTNGGGGGGG